jgi:HUS1 checkpoint protein
MLEVPLFLLCLVGFDS